MSYPGSNYPNGFSRGVAIQQIPIYTAINPDNKVIWVDENAAVNSDGTYRRPYATIDAAIGKADAGDMIVIAAGHTENLSANTIFQVDVNDLTIVGLGEGANKPTFSSTVAAGCVNIDNQNCTISGIRLVANYTGGSTNAFDVDANGCTIDNCDIIDTSATKEWLVGANVVAAATDFTFQNNTCIGLAGSATGWIVFAGASTRTKIVNNYIDVDTSDSTIDHQTTAAVNILLKDNIIINRDTGAAGYCIECKTASTGVAAGNFAGYNKVDAEVFLGDALFWFENYASNTIAESGTLDPSTSHAIP